MSDYICFEIQAQIMKRLPVKSLIRFRSVSKPWKTLIESSGFIAEYYLHNAQQQQNHHLLIRYFDPTKSDLKYVSIVDDDTFPLHNYPVTVPVSVKLLDYPIIITSQAGLFCFYNFYQDPSINRTTRTAVIWNPLISKSVEIEVPNVLAYPYETVAGISVCPKTSDVKLVKISFFRSDDITSFPWHVEVFTLILGVWRSPLCSKLLRNSIELTPDQVDLDGVVYWHAYDIVMVDYKLVRINLIMSFDMTSEEFAEIRLPDSLAIGYNDLILSKLKESLVLFEYKSEVNKRVCGVWMMEDGVPQSFTKLFTINMSDTSIIRVLGFRMTGELVTVRMKRDSDAHHGELFVYEPHSKTFSSIDICGKRSSFFASSYPETLLLLDQ